MSALEIRVGDGYSCLYWFARVFLVLSTGTEIPGEQRLCPLLYQELLEHTGAR